jgi:hypothetical protein
MPFDYLARHCLGVAAGTLEQLRGLPQKGTGTRRPFAHLFLSAS